MNAFRKTMFEDLYVKPAFMGDLDSCYQQGQAAASQAFAATHNPYPEGSSERQWWDGGYHNETDELTGE